MFKIATDLETLRIHCHVDDGNEKEDKILLQYVKSAIARTETRLNRKLYETQESIPSGEDGLVINDDLISGILLLTSFLYENRDSIGNFNDFQIPVAYNFFVDPYRFIPL